MINMLVLCINYFMGVSVLWEVLQRDYDSTLMKGEALVADSTNVENLTDYCVVCLYVLFMIFM